MNHSTDYLLRHTWSALLAAALWLPSAQAADAGGLPPQAAEKEREYLRVLQSNASPAERAMACKHLAYWGSDASVPALAALLSDKDLASWALIPLEAIPGPVADEALRTALERLSEKSVRRVGDAVDPVTARERMLVVGVINSIGVRRDAKAVPALASRLSNPDVEIASAAAVALGKIATEPAASALLRAVSAKDTAPAVAEGAIRCAQNLLTAEKRRQAAALYEAVRRAPVSDQRVLEATRGLILARGDSGIPLLLEELRSPDKDKAGMALRTARELTGRKATEAIAAELRDAPPERRPLLLLALADRGDAAALPSVVEAARTGSMDLRLAAVGVLERLGNLPSVEVLLETAADPDKKLAEAGTAALVRLPGEGIDNDLLKRLQGASGKQREALIRVAGQRKIEGSLPLILASATDPDPATRAAALQAVGRLGDERDLPRLVPLLEKTGAGRGEVETALLSISSRSGPKSVPHLQPLVKSHDAEIRSVALRALAAAGGPDALSAVKAATSDPDEALQDEAVRTLSTWPNTWPEDAGVVDPLLGLAREGKKKSHQVLALRGYLQYVQTARTLKPDQKAAAVRDILPLAQRPEEKRLAISVLDDAPSAATLDLLKALADDSTVAEDACSGLMRLTGRMTQGLTTEQRRAALQTVLDKSQNEAVKKRAQERIGSL